MAAGRLWSTTGIRENPEPPCGAALSTHSSIPSQLAPSQRPLMLTWIFPPVPCAVSMTETILSGVLASIVAFPVEASGAGQTWSMTILVADCDTIFLLHLLSPSDLIMLF